MDEAVIARMKEVEAVVKEVDPEVRGAAFAMMQSYIVGGTLQRADRQLEPPAAHDPGGAPDDGGGTDDAVPTFFSGREIEKPSDAVYAIAGYFYSVYGSAPFTVEEMGELAGEVRLTLPDRPDATLRMARRKKKTLFKQKDGSWAPTTMGEIVLKEMFGITKGRKKRPAPEASADE